MKKAWIVLLLVILLAGCAGSGSTRSYESEQGVVLYVEVPEEGLAQGEVLPAPRGGWKALVEKVKIPDAARRGGAKGEVVARVTIGDGGSIKFTEITRHLGYGCDEAVLEAIAQATFEPGTIGGEPVQRSLSLVFSFDPKLTFTVGRL